MGRSVWFRAASALNMEKSERSYCPVLSWERRQDVLKEEGEGTTPHDTIRRVDKWCHGRDIDTVTGLWPAFFSASAWPEQLAYSQRKDAVMRPKMNCVSERPNSNASSWSSSKQWLH